MAPPGGGPEDHDAPQVVRHAPGAGAIRVATDAPLVIEFSERMNRSLVRDGLRIAPWPGKLECRWEGEALICDALDGWGAGQTHTVLLGAPAADRRRNGLETPLLFAFSTGDSLARGRVTGRLRTRSVPAGGVPVFLFEWPPGLEGPLPAEAELRPDLLTAVRIDETESDGGFEFPFVPYGRRFLAAALHDRDGNRAFDEGSDLWGFSEYPVFAADSAAADSLSLYLVFADESGELAGSIVDSACAGFVPPGRLRAQADSLRGMLSGERDATGFVRAVGDSAPAIELTIAERESLHVELERLEARTRAAAAESVRCATPIWVTAYRVADGSVAAEVRSGGRFRLEDLPPDTYRLEAFRDLDGDGRRQAAEPHGAVPAEIRLLPGRAVEALELPVAVPGDGEARRGGSS
jgi:hypothetical protein